MDSKVKMKETKVMMMGKEQNQTEHQTKPEKREEVKECTYLGVSIERGEVRTRNKRKNE